MPLPGWRSGLNAKNGRKAMRTIVIAKPKPRGPRRQLIGRSAAYQWSSKRKQVSRLGIILLGPSRRCDRHAVRQSVLGSGVFPIRPLHGYWDSSEFSSDSLGTFVPARSGADTLAVHLYFQFIIYTR